MRSSLKLAGARGAQAVVGGGSIANRRVRWSAWAIALILAAGVWLLVVRWRDSGFHWELFRQSMLEVRWPWLAASYALILCTYFGRVLRWSVLIKPICPRPDMRRLFVATVIGFTGLFLLGRPGELVRPYLIARYEKLSVSSQMAAWIIERIYDILVVLAAFGFALTQIPGGLAVPSNLRLILDAGGHAVTVTAALCLGVLFAFRFFSGWARRRILEGLEVLPEPSRRHARGLLLSFIEGVQATRSLQSTLLLVAYTLMEWALITGCYYALFLAFPPTAGCSWQQVVSFLGFVSVGSLLQIPGVGGGMQVAGVIVLTEFLHVPLEASTGISLLIWAMTFVAVVPLGVILAFREGLNWRKLKELRDEEAAQEDVS